MQNILWDGKKIALGQRVLCALQSIDWNVYTVCTDAHFWKFLFSPIKNDMHGAIGINMFVVCLVNT